MLITAWGDDPICPLFFRWVVQPPTNSNILFFLMSPPWDDFPNSNHFFLTQAFDDLSYDFCLYMQYMCLFVDIILYIPWKSKDH